jgi:hypothetical protein
MGFLTFPDEQSILILSGVARDHLFGGDDVFPLSTDSAVCDLFSKNVCYNFFSAARNKED